MMTTNNLHPLAGLSLTATIDWVEVVLTLEDSSQWHPLKRRMRATWGRVRVESLGSPESSTEFRFRVQDPGSPDQFMQQLQAVARAGEVLPESAVQITGIEVAIDARHPSNDPEILSRAALYFFQHQAHLPAGLPRVTVPPYFDAPKLAALHAAAKEGHAVATARALQDGTEPPPPLRRRYGTRSVVRSPAEALYELRRGLTINQGKAPNLDAGDRGDSYRSRVYFKSRDTRDSVRYALLEPEEHSARTERTLQDSEVPFSTIAGWREFRFEALAKRFALVAPVSPVWRAASDTVVQFGIPAPGHGTTPRPTGAIAKSLEPSYRRQKRPGTGADSYANAAITRALRALTRQSPPPPPPPPTTPTPPPTTKVRENSDKFSGPKNTASLGEVHFAGNGP